MMPEELFTQIRDILTNYERDIEYKTEESAKLDVAIQVKKEEFSSIAKQLSEAKVLAQEKVEKFEENTGVYGKENARIKDENNALIAQTADLKTQNIRLAKENKEFRKYESQAWKVLNAKDSSLLERERIIQQKESLRPSVQSFLPPAE